MPDAARSDAKLETALVGLALALSALFVALVCFRPTGTVDLWWTLQVGDYIRAQGDVPRTALWTLDALRDHPYVCHGWLGAWAFAAVAQTLGLDAVPLVPTLVGLAVLASLVGLGRQLGASWLASVVVADALLYVVTLRMINRSEVFAYLCFALALNAVAGYLRTRRPGWLVALVALAWVWANAHGSFPLGLTLAPIAAAGLALDAWRRAGFRLAALPACVGSRDTARLAATTLAAAALTLVNPYGVELWRSIVEPSQSDTMTRYLDEWRPLWADGALPPRFLVPAALLAAALGAGFRRVSFVSVGLAAAVTALALSAGRHISFFGIGAAFALQDFASGLAPGRRTRVALAAALVAAGVAGNAYTLSALGLDGRRLSEHPSPFVTAQGLAFVLEHAHGNVLNPYHLGGLLTWYGYPDIRVAIDSRAAPFPPDYYLAYRQALYGPAAATRDFVERYAIDHIVLDRGVWERRFRAKLPQLREFRRVYEDEHTVVLSRR